MSSLTIFTLSPISRAISSRTGATRRQGPHHSAQKSTRTGVSASSTSAMNVSSVTALVAPMSFVLQSRYRCSVRQRGDVALGVERRGRAGAGGRDGLLVRVVDQVAGGEHARLVGPGAGRVDQDVPVVVEVDLIPVQL